MHYNRLAESDRILGLDILRASAVTLVVISHSYFLINPIKEFPYFDRLYPVLYPVVGMLGFWGVDLFFVLSGFLIGRILIMQFIDSKNFSFVDVKKFWIRRWFRTLPNYYLFLLLNSLLYYLYYNRPFTFPSFFKYFFLTQNLFTPFEFFFTESWI